MSADFGDSLGLNETALFELVDELWESARMARKGPSKCERRNGENRSSPRHWYDRYRSKPWSGQRRGIEEGPRKLFAVS
jgi:hypothetical protein